jgi:DNA-binding protein YbaB
LIVGAMGDASQQVTKMAQERLGALAGGMGAPQPKPPAPPTRLPGL